MDAQKRYEMIRRMIHPNVTVPSLAMYARRMAKESPEALRAFLEVSCENDISKTAAVVHQPLGDNSPMAWEFVHQILVDRCQSPDRFTHLDLLAIAVYNDQKLLQEASAFFTEQLLKEAFALADAAASCWLLRMSLVHLPEAPCALVRSAFCASIFISNSRMDSVLPELLPLLPEYDAADVLSVLVEIAGVKRIEALYGGDLFPVADHLICSGKDSVPLWEIYFDHFFSQPHTPEELLVEGLWHLEMYASENIIYDVCSIFYFHAATHYGVDHPVFEHILGFSAPAEHSRKHTLRYRDTVEALWDQPETLSHFLSKTAICNPFSMERVQKNGYTLFESAHDPVSYHKLTRLFEANASASTILNIFFSTDLKLNLPLEDVFYLALRYEVLPDFPEALKAMSFSGTITKQNARALVVSPLSYFTTNLHVMSMAFQVVKKAGYDDNEQKGREINYTIVGFRNGFIQTAIYEDTALPAVKIETLTSWADAVEELRNLLTLPNVPASQLQQLAITNFTLDSFTEENDFNLLTQLILDNPGCLPVFLDTLTLCKWNSRFRADSWIFKKRLYDNLRQYYEPVLKLFETLFASQQDITSVLDLYFSSIYKAILPLNKLLFLADQQLLMEFLPNYTIYCRLPVEGSNLCRPVNILCGSVCSVDNTEGLHPTEPFAATIADFLIRNGFAYRITMTQNQISKASIKKRGEMFGYLAKNIVISERRSKIISTFPNTKHCTYREIVFNMVCMESALKLRRSDGGAVRQLLQVLGKANPYAFQVSSFADLVYLKRFRTSHWRKGSVLDTATTMILNAEGIDDVRDFYLHTNIKYYMRLPALAQLVCQRREGLAEQLPTMFDSTVFYAIADSQGMLCMPWVAQNTLQVGKQHAGKVLHCHLILNKDGTILVTVLQAYQSETFFDIWNLCLLTGYHPTPEMDILVDRSGIREKLQASDNSAAADGEIPAEDVPPFSEMIGMIRELLHDPGLQPSFFAKQIGRLIRTYHTSVSQQEMEAAVAGLTEKWLRLLPSSSMCRTFLLGFHKCYANRYRSADLGLTLCRQCHQYTSSKFADSFEKSVTSVDMLADAPAAPDTDISEETAILSDPNAAPPVCAPSPFDEDLNKLKAMLPAEKASSSGIVKKIGLLIRTHHDSVSQQEMESAVAELTAEFMRRYPKSAHIRTDLLGLHECFALRYQSDSLGFILCQQARQYLKPAIADFLETRIAEANAQPPTVHHTSGPLQDSAMEPAFSQSLAKLQETLRDPQTLSNGIAKQIGGLIRDYHATVSQQEMAAAVAELTAEFMYRYPEAAHLKPDLLGLHECFAYRYQSDSLGLILCQQARQYHQPAIADFLETRIAEENAQTSNIHHASVVPQAAAVKPTFSQSLVKLQETLCDPQALSSESAKQIGKLIRDYHTTIALQEMLMAVAELTAQFIQRYSDEEGLKRILTGFHERFILHYQSVDLSLVLSLQAYQYLDFKNASAFELRIRASKEFRKYADPKLQFDYFMDRERIPPWKDLCYVT